MDFVFGAFVLDLFRRELRHSGVVRPLEPKAFTVLAYLLTHRDRAVPKEELLETGWLGEFVTESALTRCLRVIRQAVMDDGTQQQVIKTLRGYGYRFVAAVETMPTPPIPTPPATSLSCPRCHTSNRVARQFCAACGQALWRPCPQCGFHNHPAERFCGGCGHDMAAIIPMATTARMGPPQAYTPAPLVRHILARQPEMVGERKMATVLVAGVEDLQTLREGRPPEAVDEILNEGFALLVAEVHRVEGFVSQVTRHGFMALFGAPLACEDHTVRALHAALGIQRAFAA